MSQQTIAQFNKVLADARRVFIDKGSDYGPTWRIMRPRTLTDQMMIKARRIRNIEEGLTPSVADEDTASDFTALINYGLMALIQLENPNEGAVDISDKRALELYDDAATRTRDLMCAKNHDYGEAWRSMRVSSFTDIILTKLQRIKKMEDRQGPNKVSEGPGSNYQDIIVYSIFAIIKIDEEHAE